MKVKDLIAALQELDGDLEVYGVSDHGQQPEKISPPSEIFMESAHYSLEDYTGDEEEAEEYGYTVKAVLL